jgi:hypothetical protein
MKLRNHVDEEKHTEPSVEMLLLKYGRMSHYLAHFEIFEERC